MTAQDLVQKVDSGNFRSAMSRPGTGGAFFDNVHEARLSDSRIRTFQRIRNGVDWGWFPDPWRFVRCAMP